MIITVDGPVASGKTTIGKMLAGRLNFDYLYSGYLYRAIAYVLCEKGIYAVENFSTLSMELLKKILEEMRIEYYFIPGGNCSICINKQSIEESLLMTPLMDRAASMLGLNNNVRMLLTDIQRNLVIGRNVIVDGRDAGAIVFPRAEYKFFLTASIQVRIKRYIERQEKIGKHCTQLEAERIIMERDQRDGRWLTKPNTIHGVITIDTSFMNKEEAVETIISHFL